MKRSSTYKIWPFECQFGSNIKIENQLILREDFEPNSIYFEQF